MDFDMRKLNLTDEEIDEIARDIPTPDRERFKKALVGSNAILRRAVADFEDDPNGVQLLRDILGDNVFRYAMGRVDKRLAVLLSDEELGLILSLTISAYRNFNERTNLSNLLEGVDLDGV